MLRILMDHQKEGVETCQVLKTHLQIVGWVGNSQSPSEKLPLEDSKETENQIQYPANLIVSDGEDDEIIETLPKIAK